MRSTTTGYAVDPLDEYVVGLLRDRPLVQRFVELHRALETTSSALERETLLTDWLRDVGDIPERPDIRRRAPS